MVRPRDVRVRSFMNNGYRYFNASDLRLLIAEQAFMAVDVMKHLETHDERIIAIGIREGLGIVLDHLDRLMKLEPKDTNKDGK